MREQIVALAGLWQALELVHQLAKEGTMDAAQLRRFNTAINSLFIRADDTTGAAAVFGGIHSIEYGFHGLAYQLEQVARQNQITIYFVQILNLQKQVSKESTLAEKIARGIADLNHQHRYFVQDIQPLVANLADVYTDTLGSMPTHKRIRIYGKGDHLQVATNQQSIRALLLAALRAAMLWHQVGGSRLKLLLQRRRMLREIYAICAQ